MTLTFSAVLLFGAASAIAVKTRATRAGAAVLLFLFGFFTAGTGTSLAIGWPCLAMTISSPAAARSTSDESWFLAS